MAFPTKGLCEEWDGIQSVRERVREGKSLVRTKTSHDSTITECVDNMDALIPLLNRLFTARGKLPEIEGLREEIGKVYAKASRVADDAHTDDCAWDLRKMLRLVKRKAQRKDPSMDIDFQDMVLILRPELEDDVERLRGKLKQKRADEDLSEDEQEHETEVEEDPESETSNNDCTPAPVPAAPAEGVEEANVASGPSRDKLVREMRDGFELKCLNDELAELQAKLDELQQKRRDAKMAAENAKKKGLELLPAAADDADTQPMGTSPPVPSPVRSMVLDDLDANARRAQYQNVPLVAMGEKSEVPQPSATPAPQQEVETTPPSKVKANSKEIPTPPDHITQRQVVSVATARELARLVAPQIPAIDYDEAEVLGEELKDYVADILLRLQQEQREYEAAIASQVQEEG